MPTRPRTHEQPLTPHADPLLDAARDAMRRGAFDEARDKLVASIMRGETPEALEELGLVSWWLDDAARTLESRERAYMLYRDRGDPRGAARVAIWLVWDNLAFRGDFAVASGWLERSRRLLDDHRETPEYGWLLLREGEVALFRGHNPRGAIDSAARAAELGRELKDEGVEFTALALEGLARVSAGDIEGGMRRLDEATVAATAGEVKEMHAVGLVCCWQIFACEQVRDFDRAAQWCLRVHEFTKRWSLRPLSAICRTQYAGVLIWRGEWEEAERELTAAARELEQARPAITGPPIARLGELRLKQGRLEEATRLFEQTSLQPQSRMGLATLALARGNADEAAAMLEQFLGQMGPDESTARAAALELIVRVHVARDDALAAAYCCEELERIATVSATVPFQASVAMARGAVQHSQKGDGLAQAISSFERAVALFEKSGAPYECARARMSLGEALRADGRGEAAAREARLALTTFDSLGAAADAKLARALLARPGVRPEKQRGNGASLTGRQVEILRLVAQGMSNAVIAKRLRLSEHTVKRHVANLLTRLGLSSRAAAAAHAAKEGLL
ncbi:MAG TPA: LuxR C-terminal-related transcriptional regulator [Gemmatimonadaceae bacterium]|nr:LuxR C-terminal-related transcriptional regulator [Gemmatimonadaceae bacterium]